LSSEGNRLSKDFQFLGNDTKLHEEEQSKEKKGLALTKKNSFSFLVKT
jgi:hypothetical protein